MQRFLWLILVISIVTLSVGTANNEMTSHVPFRHLTAEQLERFHGHLGPFVALGARMGEHAVTHRDMPRYFGVRVRVHCPAAPPYSCLIDGLQMSIGATMGKKNLEHHVDDSIEVTITNEKNGESVSYRILDSVQQMGREWEEAGLGVEERGHKLFAMRAEDLFEIK